MNEGITKERIPFNHKFQETRRPMVRKFSGTFPENLRKRLVLKGQIIFNFIFIIIVNIAKLKYPWKNNLNTKYGANHVENIWLVDSYERHSGLQKLVTYVIQPMTHVPLTCLARFGSQRSSLLWVPTIAHFVVHSIHMGYNLLIKLVRSRWLDIGQVLFCVFMDRDDMGWDKTPKQDKFSLQDVSRAGKIAPSCPLG